MTPIIFDIETGSLPIDTLKAILPPFDPTSLGPAPGDFGPASVKLGNIKDPVKIEAKIKEAEAKHRDAAEKYASDLEKAEPAYWAGILDRAALSAITGEVLAIGYSGQVDKIQAVGGDKTEATILAGFWEQYGKARKVNRKLMGWNIKGFDIPFLVQRSYIAGVPVPSTVLDPRGYLDQTFVDLSETWRAGVRSWPEKGLGQLSTVAKALGLPGKADGLTGADFARLFRSDDPAEQQQAIAYLLGDLSITRAIAERIGAA